MDRDEIKQQLKALDVDTNLLALEGVLFLKETRGEEYVSGWIDGVFTSNPAIFKDTKQRNEYIFKLKLAAGVC